MLFFQVNVKYEDLPNFLKVAEAMRIKGLHTEVGIIVSFIDKLTCKRRLLLPGFAIMAMLLAATEGDMKGVSD